MGDSSTNYLVREELRVRHFVSDLFLCADADGPLCCALPTIRMSSPRGRIVKCEHESRQRQTL